MTNPEYIRELPGGLRLAHRHMPDTDSVTLQIFFGAGGRYEDMRREYGVSHFLEHLLKKVRYFQYRLKIISKKFRQKSRSI